jgi:hypothetical protein
MESALNNNQHVNKVTKGSQEQLDSSCKAHRRQLGSDGRGQQICRKQKVHGQIFDAVQEV